MTNLTGMRGTLADALRGADVFVGVSVPGVLTAEMIRTMAKDPIVFAMANPTPEIAYDERQGGRRARDGHRPVGFSQPDQQPAGVPGGIQGRAVRQGEGHQL